MRIVRDQAVLELNKNNERVLQRQLEATKDRFGVGEVTRTDVSQAESRFSRARADRISAEGNDGFCGRHTKTLLANCQSYWNRRNC